MSTPPQSKKRRVQTRKKVTWTFGKPPKQAFREDASSIPRPPDGHSIRLNLKQACIAGDAAYLRAVLDDPELAEAATQDYFRERLTPACGGQLCRQGRQSCPCDYAKACYESESWCDCPPAEHSRGVFKPSTIEVRADGAGAKKCTPVPLLFYACEHGHVEAARALLERGAVASMDVEHPHAGRRNEHWNLLVLTCRAGHRDVVQLLVEEGKAEITPWTTHIKEPRVAYDNDGAPVSAETPLAVAAEKGRADIVQLLLNHGALDVKSVKKDFSSENERYQSLGKKLVQASAKTARDKAWQEARRGSLEHGAVLEALGQAGTFMYTILCKAREDMIKSSELDEKKDQAEGPNNFTDEGKPAPHLISLIRAMRFVSADCLKASGVVISADPGRSGEDCMKEKKEIWRGIVSGASKNAEKETNASATESPWRQRWSELLEEASKPWSRQNHHLFPPAVRRRALDLARIGSRLALTHLHGGSDIRDVFENYVMPLIVG